MTGRLRFGMVVGAAVLLAFALTVPAAGAAPRDDDHAATVDILSDIRHAIDEIARAEGAPWSGPDEYKAAAQRALVALEGDGADGTQDAPPRESGAIERIERLLDRREDRPWEPVLEGALVNIRAAAAHLHDAGDTRSLDDFSTAASQALEYLEVAQGRASDPGVLGGMAGAAANTELAVPAGAKSLDGCSAPRTAGYGVRDGYLAWRAVPLGRGPIPVAGAQNLRVSGDMAVFYTAAAPLVQQRCAAKKP